MNKVWLIVAFSLFGGMAWSQSCCSGGAPLSGNLGLPIAEGKNLQFSISYDLNKLNTLKSGTETLDDKTRTRTTHTLLFQTGYTFNKNFGIEILVPYVRQERKIRPIGLPSTFEQTTSLGDLVVLTKYRFLNDYQVGIGIKLPSGTTEKTNSSGLTLNADLQPGSGSWDLIYWFSSQHQLKIRKSLTLTTLATFRATGENDNYLGRQTYQFGNEWQLQMGLSDQLLLFSQVISPSLSVKYRSVQADANDGFEVPSTGGRWLFIKPGLSYAINSDIILMTTLDIPVYANLEGTQVTPTFRFNTSVLFNLNLTRL